MDQVRGEHTDLQPAPHAVLPLGNRVAQSLNGANRIAAPKAP